MSNLWLRLYHVLCHLLEQFTVSILISIEKEDTYLWFIPWATRCLLCRAFPFLLSHESSFKLVGRHFVFAAESGLGLDSESCRKRLQPHQLKSILSSAATLWPTCKKPTPELIIFLRCQQYKREHEILRSPCPQWPSPVYHYLHPFLGL